MRQVGRGSGFEMVAVDSTRKQSILTTESLVTPQNVDALTRIGKFSTLGLDYEVEDA